MRCPYCDNESIRVIDSRSTEESNAIRRRRECDDCGKRFTTYETVESIPLMVVKKDHKREPFSHDKLMSGLVRSCHKRPVSIKEIDEIVDDIENRLYNSTKKEIRSSYIGEIVMEKLKLVDEVAYVRFASIYREFKDISTFMSELTKILKDKEKTS